MDNNHEVLLKVDHLCQYFRLGRKDLKAVDDVSFEIRKGESFGLVGGIALVLGILLAVLSHFFSVPEDPTFTKIRECLPSVNCGACGYAGCDDYATALANGTEKRAGLCIPGTKAVAEQIGNIKCLRADRTGGTQNCNGIIHTITLKNQINRENRSEADVSI